MVRRHQDDLMNHLRMPAYDSAVEGLNNKAKAIIGHKFFGFQTAKSYIRNLYRCVAELPLPKTMHIFA